jgi:His/Glu/Gln/Arg/opine family amino acid ABC transporter permease subunit
MDFSIILKEWPTYWEGLYTTIWLVAASLMLGMLAVPMGILRNSRNWLIKGPIWAYIYFFRGTPLLVQLFIIYYGPPSGSGSRTVRPGISSPKPGSAPCWRSLSTPAPTPPR